MKLNPYSMLLTVGACMYATAALTQFGAGGQLAREGAHSVDQDISSFAARTLGGSNGQLRASADTGSVAGELDKGAGLGTVLVSVPERVITELVEDLDDQRPPPAVLAGA